MERRAGVMVTLYYFGAILFVGSSRSALAFAAAGMILGAPTALPPSPILSVATPFSSSSGSVVDWSAFDAYLESLHHAGIQAVLCNGLEGEGNSLTSEERQRVAERCRLKFSGAVLCDVSDSCSRRAIQNVAWCSPYVDALLLRAPACDDAHGLEAFLSEVISTSPIPVLLHHTGVELGGEGALSPSTYASITNKHSLVVGVLESSGSITTMKALAEAVPPSLLTLWQGDANMLEALRAGADGVVSGASYIPSDVAAIINAHERGNGEAAESAQELLRGHLPACSIPDIKWKLSKTIPGFHNTVRLPLVPKLGPSSSIQADVPARRDLRHLRERLEKAEKDLTDYIFQAAGRPPSAPLSDTELDVLETLSSVAELRRSLQDAEENQKQLSGPYAAKIGTLAQLLCEQVQTLLSSDNRKMVEDKDGGTEPTTPPPTPSIADEVPAAAILPISATRAGSWALGDTPQARSFPNVELFHPTYGGKAYRSPASAPRYGRLNPGNEELAGRQQAPPKPEDARLVETLSLVRDQNHRKPASAILNPLPANDYQKLEQYQFFESKGITNADADTFDWNAIRRNTPVIEQHQKRIASNFWRKKQSR